MLFISVVCANFFIFQKMCLKNRQQNNQPSSIPPLHTVHFWNQSWVMQKYLQISVTCDRLVSVSLVHHHTSHHYFYLSIPLPYKQKQTRVTINIVAKLLATTLLPLLRKNINCFYFRRRTWSEHQGLSEGNGQPIKFGRISVSLAQRSHHQSN